MKLAISFLYNNLFSLRLSSKTSVGNSYVILLTASLILISCYSKSNKESNRPSPQAKSYGTITLTPRSCLIYSDFPANIQGQQDVEIRPNIDGYLANTYIDEGSVVRKGQLLFRINAPIYEQNVRTAEANIKIAQADLDAALMQVNKVRPLVEQDIVSKYELQSAEFTLKSKKAALSQAEATLINAKVNLGYASIYSPANGVIGELPFTNGSLVSSTAVQPLTTVSNIQKVYAYFALNEKQQLDFFNQAKGSTIKEKLATYPPVTLLLSNGTIYDQKGRIETLGGLVNPATGSISLRATFPNLSGMIRSGSSATVRIPQTLDNVILIPQSATYQIQGKLFVYVLSPDNTVHSTAIQVNPSIAGHSYVLQTGLNPGARIIVEGIGNISEGSLIKPRNLNVDSVYVSL